MHINAEEHEIQLAWISVQFRTDPPTNEYPYLVVLHYSVSVPDSHVLQVVNNTATQVWSDLIQNPSAHLEQTVGLTALSAMSRQLEVVINVFNSQVFPTL